MSSRSAWDWRRLSFPAGGPVDAGADQAAQRSCRQEEERARGNDEPRSIRLATEFHILLAEMTGSPVLTRYVSENASRCGLTLALYSRPHSSECAVNEHRAIIAALAKGDVASATR